MAKDDRSSLKDGPFNDAVERQEIRSNMIKAGKMWPFISPFVAVAENKKAVGVVLALIATITYLTRADVQAAIRVIVGGGS